MYYHRDNFCCKNLEKICQKLVDKSGSAFVVYRSRLSPIFRLKKISDFDFLKINESYFAFVIIDFNFFGYYSYPYNVYFQVVENTLYSNQFQPSDKLLKFLLSFLRSTFGFGIMFLAIDGFH